MAYEARMQAKGFCAECGGLFCGRKGTRFCSKRCRARRTSREWVKKNRDKKIAKDRRAYVKEKERRIAALQQAPTSCPNCNTEFTRTRADKKYCSSRCRRNSNLRRYYKSDKGRRKMAEYKASHPDYAERKRAARRIIEATQDYKNSRKEYWGRPENAARRKANVSERAKYRWETDPVYREKRKAAYTNHRHKRRLRKTSVLGSATTTEIRQIVYGSKKCGICNKTFKMQDKRSLDHIIPLSKGGSHDLYNLQAAHLSCNIEKNNRAPAGTLPLMLTSSI